jgi:CHAD domain-containing protein
VTIEREVKLPVPPTFEMPALDDIGGELRTVRHDDVDLDTVYYDAPDLRLIRAGASLRYREGRGWTAKLPTGGDTSLLARHEAEFPDEGGVVPTDALELLRAYLRTVDVVPVLRLRTRRRRWEVTDEAGRPVVDVDDDLVEVVSGTPSRLRFREIEVELRADDAAAVLDEVVDRLRRAGAGEPDPTPKPARALGAVATAPADVTTRMLPSKPAAGDVIRSAFAGSVAGLIRHDPVIRLDADPEGVHQARVATRRLRSDLRTFAPLLDDRWAAALRAELTWLGDALGAARDADVLLDRIRARVASLADAERPAATEIVGALERRDKDAHAALTDVLSGARYAALLDMLVEAANAPSVTDDASARAKDALPRLVRRPWKALRESVRDAGDAPTDEALHAVRIGAKRLRYAAEAVAHVVGKPARRLAASAEVLQDVLGEHRDAVVAAGWLRAWAVDASPDGAFAAGVLAGHEEAAAADARATWHAAWRALDHRKLRSWM